MDKYIGKLLDNRYEILEVIGTGGMAMVYKAKCHRLNRLVAVKILKDEFSQDVDFRRRFHTESQAVAMLSHPNIVSVYDVSKSSETEYIVMELIDGISLKDYMVKKGALTWREALHFITQIVKALDHAHSRGIIHRDIKPHNIMVLRDGSVRVTDFGIAHLASTQNTLTQEALGSVHYISPEQAKGGMVDFRSDIYSAGVVLYEMLTNTLPFDGDTPVAVAIQHINSVPRAPREIAPEIPEGLEEITLKAMCPDIEKRYNTAEEMLENLEEFRKDPKINFNYDVNVDSQGLNEDSGKVKKIKQDKKERRKKDLQLIERYAKQDKQRDQVKRAGRVSILAGVAAVLVFILALTYFLWTFFFQDLFVAAPEITVPDFVGKVYDVAASDEKYSDFVLVCGSTEESDVYAEGTIIGQSPENGSLVKKGATITLTVSSGAKIVTMPDILSLTWRQAQENLEAELQGEILYSIETSYMISEDVESGCVISTQPAPGDRLRNGANISVIISKGADVEIVKVPDVVGKPLYQAQASIEALGLEVGNIEEVENDAVKDTVIYQNYAPGSEVEKGSIVIDLQISLGPAPEPDDLMPQPGVDDPETDPENSAEPDEKTSSVSLNIPVPYTEGQVYVEVWQDDMRMIAGNYDGSIGSFNFIATGSGVQKISVYCGGVLTYTTQVDFSLYD